MRAMEIAEIFRRARKAKRLSRDRLAERAVVSSKTVQRLEDGLRVNRTNLRAIARELDVQLDPETIDLLTSRVGDDDAASVDLNSAAAFLKGHGLEPSDQNIDSPPKSAHAIPEWESEIAAGNWIDCIAHQLDSVQQRDAIERGRFMIRIRGESMTPDYMPGEKVLFRVVRLDEEQLIVGADYAWQNTDGLCTLKRLTKKTDDEFTLSPLNAAYKPLILKRDMLARVSIVETIVRAPWQVSQSAEKQRPASALEDTAPSDGRRSPPPNAGIRKTPHSKSSARSR